MHLRKIGQVIVIVILFFQVPHAPQIASAKSYTITPNSKPINSRMIKYSTYNKDTKHYYLLRSYLEKFEKEGRGTLILEEGTYTISNTLFVPSNVTIRMKDGVKLIKGSKTGTDKFEASKSLFQLIRPTSRAKKNVFGVYNGEKNITFIGEGKVIFDLKYRKSNFAIIAGHNKNIKIEGITFQHMQLGHFIEMDANENAIIRNNQFIDAKASPAINKEAINLDTPDHVTGGWTLGWSKFDQTPNRNILIENNTFKNLDRAIGTHKYSQDNKQRQKYHEKIIIKNNYIEKTTNDAIRIMNWSNSIIEGNTIKNVSNGKGSNRGILASGAINPMIRNNKFILVPRPMQFYPWKNNGTGSSYDITYNQLSKQNISALKTNNVSKSEENYITINNTYAEFSKNTTKVFLK